MAIRVKLKNSVVANKAPLPTDLEIGEVAINANASSPAAYIKDTAGNVVKLAGSGAIGGTPATETAAGIVELATAAETVAGADATRAVTPAGLKSALAAQVGSSTAPTTPTAGQVWVNSSVTPSVVNVWNGTAWVPQVGATITSATAPATPATGQVWIDTSVNPNAIKIWDGTTWVTAAPDGSAAAAIANDAKYATKAELQAEDLWDRAGTEITPKTAGDTVQISPGTAALPGLTPVGDPNTGVFSAGADQIGLATNGTGRLFVDSNGRIGAGIPNPGAPLAVASEGGLNLMLVGRSNAPADEAQVYFMRNDGSTLQALIGANNDNLSFHTGPGGSERARLDESGRLLVGTSSSTNNIRLNQKLALVQAGTDAVTGLSAVSYSGANTQDAPTTVDLCRSRGSTDGSMTVVGNGDSLGEINFRGSDGSSFVTAAQIKAFTDGGVGSGDMPGRIVLSTTASGASSPTERVRISSAGDVFLRQAGGSERVYFTDAGAASIGPASFAASSTTLYIGNAAIQVSSDVRLKDNIEDTALDALDAISKIKVKDFTWNDPSDTSFNNRNARGKWTGLIAQELVEILPFVVNAPRKEEDGSIDYESEERWLLDQSQLCPVLIKAIQQQQEIIAGLEARIAALEAS